MLKTCQGGPHFLSGCFINVFYKTTTCQRRPLLGGPKSGCLKQVLLYMHFTYMNMAVLTKTWIHFKQPTMMWNDLQRTRNNLKRPTTIWKNLQQIENDLKRPFTEKKEPKMIHNEWKPTYNNLNLPTTKKKDAKLQTRSIFWD